MPRRRGLLAEAPLRWQLALLSLRHTGACSPAAAVCRPTAAPPPPSPPHPPHPHPTPHPTPPHPPLAVNQVTSNQLARAVGVTRQLIVDTLQGCGVPFAGGSGKVRALGAHQLVRR